jgi:hypothetical protein
MIPVEEASRGATPVYAVSSASLEGRREVGGPRCLPERRR